MPQLGWAQTVPILAVFICLPLLVNGSYFFSRFLWSLGREVFVWLLAIHKGLKVNMWLNKIDFMCIYLFQCIEGLNKYLSVKKFTSADLKWKQKSCHISENEPEKSAKGSAHFQSSSAPWNDARNSGAKRWLHFWRGGDREKRWSQSV